MWDLILYVGVACFISWIFKLAVGLLSGLVGMIAMFLLGLKSGFKSDRMEALMLLRYPKTFFGYGVFVHATVGSLYALIIVLFTGYHVHENGGSLWLYIPLSFLWGLSLLNGAEAYRGTLLSSCLLGLILAYIGLGFLGPFVAWPLVLIASLFYYFGRIDLLKQQLLEAGEYEQIMASLEEA